MIWYIVMQLFSTLLEWVRIGRLSEREKDLEILILRKQLMIVEQRLDKPMHLSRAERLMLAVISTKLKTVSGRSLKELREVIRLVQPETVFKWHCELVRRKWTYRRKQVGGRPRTHPDIEELIVHLAHENRDWAMAKSRESQPNSATKQVAKRLLTSWSDMEFSLPLNEVDHPVGVT